MTLFYSIVHKWNFGTLMLATLALCSACSEDSLPAEGQAPIGFGMNDTRAVINQVIDIQAFSVWARFSNSQTPEMTLMDGEVVYRDPEDTNFPKRFTYDHTKYWIDGTYDFYAIHPSTESSAYDFITLDNEDQTLTISGFDSSSQTDLAVVTDRVRRVYPSEGTGDVEFSLRHVLTQVKVTLLKDEGNESDVIEVTSIQLSGMKAKGTYTAQITSDTGGWSSLDETYTWRQTLSDNNTLQTTGGLVSTALLIPQTPENLTLTVNFQITHGSAEPQPSVKSVNLPVATWQENAIVNYRCTLGVDYNITLGSVTITPWGNKEAGGTVIIK